MTHNPIKVILKLSLFWFVAASPVRAELYIRPVLQYSKLTYQDSGHNIQTKGSSGGGIDFGSAFGAKNEWEVGGEITSTAFKGSYPAPVWSRTGPVGGVPSSWEQKPGTPYVVQTVLANARRFFGAEVDFVRPYVSAALGLNVVSIETAAPSAGGLGVTGGVGAGLMFFKGKHFHLDVGYRYLVSSSSSFINEEDTQHMPFDAAFLTHEFKYNAHNAYLALHWRF